MQKKVLAALILAFSAGIAHAQSPGEPGWYAGIDLGRARSGIRGGDVDGALASQGIAASSSVDQTDTALGLNGGFRFNRSFALEGAYARLGDFSYSAPTATDTLSGKYKANALSLAAIGLMPLGADWSLYGKAGLAYTRASLSASSANGTTATQNPSHSSTGLLLGAGVQYDFTRSFYTRAGWDRYARVGDGATGKGDIDVYSIGVGMRF